MYGIICVPQEKINSIRAEVWAFFFFVCLLQYFPDLKQLWAHSRCSILLKWMKKFHICPSAPSCSPQRQPLLLGPTESVLFKQATMLPTQLSLGGNSARRWTMLSHSCQVDCNGHWSSEAHKDLVPS